MDQDETDKTSELKARVVSAEAAPIANIPFELLEKQGNRTTKLVETSGDVTSIDGRRRWHDFRFKRAFLVTQVIVQTTGYGERNEFELVWVTETGAEHRTSALPTEDKVIFEVNDICAGVSFRPPSVFFNQAQIHSVRIEGITRDDVPAALDALSDLDFLKQSIIDIVDRAIGAADKRIVEATAADLHKAEVQKEIATLKQTAVRTKKSVDELSLKKNELIAENGVAARDLQSSRERNLGLKQTNSALEEEIEKLSVKRAENEGILKDLRNNINLFPTEIVEFVNQGSKNIRLYFWLAAAPIVVIILMFFLLTKGAADLTTVITSRPDVNIEALMLSRVPYVSIALAIIAACYKIARAFFTEMIRINSQRLNLTKVSIIAKDVSSAAERGLNMSEEELYRLRTEMKMALLKDHLKDYISKDFTIELPKQIVGALTVDRAAEDG